MTWAIFSDPELPLTLHKLRSSGKKLFLLTNSQWDYTTHVMSFLLEGQISEYPSWRHFFDVIVVGAHKPRFFLEACEKGQDVYLDFSVADA